MPSLYLRVRGRVIRFDYVKDSLTPEELHSSSEKELKDGTNTMVKHGTVCLIHLLD